MGIGLLTGRAFHDDDLHPSDPELAVVRLAGLRDLAWGFQVVAYVEAVKRNEYIRALVAQRPVPTPGVARRGDPVPVLAPVGVRQVAAPGTGPDLQDAFIEAFGDRWQYAWEVARCETGGFNPAVIYGPRRGAAGELGLFQLHPRGLLPGFWAAGYEDPFNPAQQIQHVAAYTAENGWLAWRGCLP